MPPALGPARALLIFLAFFGVQLVTGMLLGVAAGVWFALRRGGSSVEIVAEAQGAVLMPAAVLGAILGGVAAGALTWRSLRGPRQGEGLRAIGWSGASRRDGLLAALAGVVLAFACLFGLVGSFPPPPGHPWGPVAQAVTTGGWSRLLWAVLAIVVAPPAEEFVFRGVLLTGLSRWGIAVAGAVVTLLFVASHLPEVWGYPPAMAAVGALGVAALTARIRTRSLVPAVVLHAAYNLALALAVYAGST